MHSDEFRDKKAYRLAEKLRRRNMARMNIDVMDSLMLQKRTHQAIYIIEREQRKLMKELSNIKKCTGGINNILPPRCKTTLPPIKSLSRTSNNESRNTITGAERVFNQGRTPDPALVTDDKEGGGGVSTVTKEQSVTQPASPADIGDTSGSQNDRLQDTRTKDDTLYENKQEMVNVGVEQSGTKVGQNSTSSKDTKKPNNLIKRPTNIQLSNQAQSPVSKEGIHHKPRLLRQNSKLPSLALLSPDKKVLPEIPIPRYAGDGTIRTRYNLPDSDESFYGASKSRYIRTKDKRWFEKELSLSDIFGKKPATKRLTTIILAKGLVSRRTTPRTPAIQGV